MKKNKGNGNIFILISLYFLCFIFISTAYSFFSEQLELKGKVGFSNNVTQEYEYDYILQQQWQQESVYYYQYSINITYMGNKNINAWNLNINVPVSTEIEGCYNAGECKINNNILKITNTDWNGNLSNGVIVTPSIIIKTTDPNYELDIVSVNFYTNEDIINPTVPDDNKEPGEVIDPDNPNKDPNEDDHNLATEIIATLNGNYCNNTSQYNLEIRNDSNINLINWELKYKVPPETKVSSCWGANYIITDDTLILSGLSWSQNIPSGSINNSVGFQITTIDPPPISIELISFIGTSDNYEEVVIK